LLIDLLMRSSKKSPKELPAAEQVLFSALRMFHDQTAISEMAEKLAVSSSVAERALAKLPKAAIAVAADNRNEKLHSSSKPHSHPIGRHFIKGYACCCD
jgi:hypothetical protein